jgi:5-methylcytosine-specific restriction protein A
MANLPKNPRPHWMPEPSKGHEGRKNANRKLYNSNRWKKDRNAHIAANPLCEQCKKEGRITASNVSDHIIPVNKGGEVWDWKNRQALCNSCHNSKSAKERW